MYAGREKQQISVGVFSDAGCSTGQETRSTARISVLGEFAVQRICYH